MLISFVLHTNGVSIISLIEYILKVIMQISSRIGGKMVFKLIAALEKHIDVDSLAEGPPRLMFFWLERTATSYCLLLRMQSLLSCTDAWESQRN